MNANDDYDPTRDPDYDPNWDWAWDLVLPRK